MKKFIALSLAVVCAAGLSLGCCKTENKTEAPATPAATTEAAAETATEATEAAAEAATETTEAAAEAATETTEAAAPAAE